ncbi:MULTISPECIES: class I SAM-dependent methyltransferase [unclassified Acinetobacter]|uniref:class I SAM-dependent methyltransferase n=1 Tax=unclassified Acinetobacter TaxID=196816 RepID=UPI00293477F4|nr:MULTISPECIES: methyltransferase domain-containing protein [unclassified Acinetobacter]WOE33329.1 methyltransferase domain-containing protein [Acinetobacter sp. SAAs470]WOE37012.1 methyltransferase domain-containing protein [Acinetobacter sp. SAAs474]
MAKDFQNKVVVERYDDHIRKLIPGYELVHQQINAILTTYLTQSAHILVVGCGTGYELSYLLQQHPNWTFTAVDTSLTMLQQAQHNLLNDQNRVEFIHADICDIPLTAQFDAAITILVGHFIAYEHKAKFYQAIFNQLKTSGYLLTYDLMLAPDPQTLTVIQHLVQHIGLSQQQSQKMLDRLKDDFQLLDIEEFQDYMINAGFKNIRSYCQIIDYYGFLMEK